VSTTIPNVDDKRHGGRGARVHSVGKNGIGSCLSAAGRDKNQTLESNPTADKPIWVKKLNDRPGWGGRPTSGKCKGPRPKNSLTKPGKKAVIMGAPWDKKKKRQTYKEVNS